MEEKAKEEAAAKEKGDADITFIPGLKATLTKVVCERGHSVEHGGEGEGGGGSEGGGIAECV
mgnify:CR=1 FL=1